MLTPSPELDRRIAEAIGWKLRGKAAIEWFDANGKPTGYCARNPFSPSADLNHAFESAEAVGLFQDRCLRKHYNQDSWWVTRVSVVGGSIAWKNDSDESTPALAICAAVLEVSKVQA